MKERIKITTLDISDWAEYKALRLKALQDAPMAFTDTLDEAVKNVNEHWIGHLKAEDNNSINLFAQKRDKLVGMIAALFDKREKMKHVAEIVGVYVDPEYRGNGIGSLLMTEIINKIKKRSEIKKINLSVITTQKAAVALYKKFGFKIAGELHQERFLDDKYYDMYLMEKIL